MVSWGANTTHVFGAPAAGTPGAPAPTAFGSPAPAPFGSAPAAFAPTPAPSSGGFFGASAPAPTTGSSLFGATPAPASGGSLFGAPTPAPGGSLFGTPAPAPGGSLFGAPASSGGGSLFGTPAPAPGGSLFGAPAPSAFGATTAATPAAGGATPQVPAQAALQEYMDASARQEAERVRAKLEALNHAYAGVPKGQDGSEFVAIVYQQMTPEQRQLLWFHGMGEGTGMVPSPPKPPHVSEKRWKQAVIENPDPNNYVPQALVGASSLQARIGWQQDRAKQLGEHANILQKSQETLKERNRIVMKEADSMIQHHVTLRRRLMDVMRRVELARCMNQPIQREEVKLMERLSELAKTTDTAQQVLLKLHDQVRSTSIAQTTRKQTPAEIPEAAQLLPVLKDHRTKLQTLMTTAQRDQRDVGLISKRVLGTGGRSQ